MPLSATPQDSDSHPILPVKFPSNGTPVANVLLVLTGLIVGVAGTWTAMQIKEGSLYQGSATEPEENSQQSFTTRGDESIRRSGSVGNDRTAARLSAVDLPMALRIRDPATRSEMLRRAGAGGADLDIAESLRAGLSITRTQDRLDYYRGLVGQWSETDPEAALDHIRHDLNPGLLQSELISLAVNKWGAENPRDAWVWTEKNLSGPLREQSQADLMIGWTRRNPSLAAAWVTDTGLQSRLLLSTVGTTWAEQDPRSAAAWADSLSTTVARQATKIAVAAEWARQDPPMAADFFENEINATEDLDLATVIADIWGTTDPAATARWIEDLQPGKVRDQAASTLASVWATRDIEAAVAWSETIADRATRSQVISHLGTTWGALDPDRAIGWLSTLSLEEAEIGLVGAFNSWAAVSPNEMLAWIDSTEASGISDLGRRSLADVISQDDILTSIDLAMGIRPSPEKTDAVSRYFRHWRKIDDTSAREWYQAMESSLPSELRDRLSRDLQDRIPPRP